MAADEEVLTIRVTSSVHVGSTFYGATVWREDNGAAEMVAFATAHTPYEAAGCALLRAAAKTGQTQNEGRKEHDRLQSSRVHPA